MISSVVLPPAATPRAFRSRCSINSPRLTEGRIRAPPSNSSNTTSVFGSSPSRSLRLAGIVTCPFDVIFIWKILLLNILHSKVSFSCKPVYPCFSSFGRKARPAVPRARLSLRSVEPPGEVGMESPRLQVNHHSSPLAGDEADQWSALGQLGYRLGESRDPLLLGRDEFQRHRLALCGLGDPPPDRAMAFV